MRLMLAFFILVLLLSNAQFKLIDIKEIQKTKIKVTVFGEVLQPGIIEVRPYITIDELLKKVGLTDNADITGMNLLTVLNDCDVITIPTKKATVPEKISINLADIETLMMIPAVGEKTAQAIIDYRNKYGLFQSLEELMNVKGIGQQKFDKIKEMICL